MSAQVAETIATSVPETAATPAPSNGGTISTSDPKATSPTPEPTKVGAKPAVDAEIKYELKMPEGSKLGAEHAKQVEAFAKEHKIAPELAQKLLERDHAQLQAQIEALHSRSKEWRASVESDKDLGGQNFNATKEHAYRALQKFDRNGELRAELEATGYGNHPAFVRFVAAIGKAMSEDTIHSGEAPAHDPLAKMYPTMSQ